MLKMTVKTRLIAAFLAILIVPCSAIGWFSYQSAKTQINDDILANAQQNTDIVNNQVSDLISSGAADMDYLAKHINSGMEAGFESPKIRTILDQYKGLHPEIEVAFYAGKDKLMLRSPEKKVDGFDPATREWYKTSMADKGKAIVNNPSVSSSTGHIVVTASKASEDGIGVVGGNIDLAKLSDTVKKVKVGKSGYVYILDKDRKYVVHPTAKVGDVNKNSYIEAYYKADSGTVDYVLNGLNKRAVFVTNKQTGWKIVGTIELTEIAAATQGILISTVVVLAIAIVLGIVLALFIVRSITEPLKRLMTTTEKIAVGDLTQEVDVRSTDELGQLAASVNHMVHNLRDLIGGVMGSSQSVAAASEEISATTEQIAGGSSAQAQAAANVQELFGELSTAINSVAESAEQAAELAAKTTSIAHDGGKIVENSVQSMNQVSSQMTMLEEDSTKIGDIIEVIDDIAAQTNLLALNAAIEAARAGEQGRGFAVVADEVRKLAERSGEATKQITEIIKGMQDNTHRSVVAVSDGVSQSQETGKAFEQIIAMINETERKVSEIAAASQEQAAQAGEFTHSIESISSASQEAAAASEETAATSQSLAQLAEGLNQSVSQFKVK